MLYTTRRLNIDFEDVIINYHSFSSNAFYPSTGHTCKQAEERVIRRSELGRNRIEAEAMVDLSG